MAGGLLDLEQSKRLLGVVSSGEVLLAALSFLAVPLLFDAGFGAVLLLTLATAALLATLLLLPVIFACHRQRLEDSGETLAERSADEPDAAVQNSAARRYLALMTAVTLLFILTQYFVDYSFLTEIRQTIPQRGELTRFLGWFFFATKTLELIVKTVGLGRLLRHLGLFGAGGLLALLARSPILGGLGPRLMIMASLLCAWLAASLALFSEYREHLLEALDRQTSQLLNSPLETIRNQLAGAERDELRLVLNVLQRVEPEFFNRSLAELLRSPKLASRSEAVERVIELRLLRAGIERFEAAESDLQLRQRAAEALRILRPGRALF